MNVKYGASNKRNDYFRVSDKDETHPVTVVHTEFGTIVCLTCLTTNCEHTKAVKESDQLKGE